VPTFIGLDPRLVQQSTSPGSTSSSNVSQCEFSTSCQLELQLTILEEICSYLALSFEKYAASILAGSALFRSTLGAGFPLFGHAFFTGLGVGGGSSLLAGVSFLLIIPLYVSPSLAALWRLELNSPRLSCSSCIRTERNFAREVGG